MKKLNANRNNLIKLLKNLKEEDRKELKHAYKSDYINKFINITLNSGEKYFYSDDFNNPLAIGGVEEKCINGNKIGQVWLISTKYFTKANLKLIKFIRNKIEDYKETYDVLFNLIYKSNYKALKWLKKCGFSVLDLKDNDDYKLFYFNKGGINFDLRYITRQ